MSMGLIPYLGVIATIFAMFVFGIEGIFALPALIAFGSIFLLGTVAASYGLSLFVILQPVLLFFLVPFIPRLVQKKDTFTHNETSKYNTP